MVQKLSFTARNLGIAKPEMLAVRLETDNSKHFGRWHGFEPPARPLAMTVPLGGEVKLHGYKFYVKSSYYGYRSKWYKTMKIKKKAFDIVKYISELVERSRKFVQISAKLVADKAKQLIETFQKKDEELVQLQHHHSHREHDSAPATPLVLIPQNLF